MSGSNGDDTFLQTLHARAAADRKTILLPESEDARTIAAARQIVAEGIAHPVLVVSGKDQGEFDSISTSDASLRERVTEHLLKRRAHKGMTEEAARLLAEDPLIFADAAVALGLAHGCVAGAVRSSADVLRSALWTIGTAEGVTTVSSSFYMVVPPFRNSSTEVLTFTDCAVVPNPNARQLADIAIAAARDRRRIIGDSPRVALLSYSTAGSAEGQSIDIVRGALALLKSEQPDLPVDGELQADAALISTVAARKVPASPIAGTANVLVFPSLDAGNISYKLVQRLAKAVAIGPILQGLALPCNDLSRGATADDIVHVAAITSLQSGPGVDSAINQGRK